MQEANNREERKLEDIGEFENVNKKMPKFPIYTPIWELVYRKVFSEKFERQNS